MRLIYFLVKCIPAFFLPNGNKCVAGVGICPLDINDRRQLLTDRISALGRHLYKNSPIGWLVIVLNRYRRHALYAKFHRLIGAITLEHAYLEQALKDEMDDFYHPDPHKYEHACGEKLRKIFLSFMCESKLPAVFLHRYNDVIDQLKIISEQRNNTVKCTYGISENGRSINRIDHRLLRSFRFHLDEQDIFNWIGQIKLADLQKLHQDLLELRLVLNRLRIEVMQDRIALTSAIVGHRVGETFASALFHNPYTYNTPKKH